MFFFVMILRSSRQHFNRGPYLTQKNPFIVPGKSLSTIVPVAFLRPNRGFGNLVRAVSPEMRCTLYHPDIIVSKSFARTKNKCTRIYIFSTGGPIPSRVEQGAGNLRQRKSLVSGGELAYNESKKVQPDENKPMA